MNEEIINAIVVDDEANLRASIINLLKTSCPQINIVGESATVKDSIELIQQIKPDLLFLDIKLADGSAFDILEQLKLSEIEMPEFGVIFTTAYDQFALKAIKYSALDYLLKPIDPDELKTSVEKYKIQNQPSHQLDQISVLLGNFSQHMNKKKKIALRTFERIIVCDIDEIIRCESHDNYTMFHLIDKKNIIVSKTLKEFEEILSDDGFERIHQSHLINIDYLKSYEKKDGGYILMHDGVRIPVALRKREKLLKLLKSL